MSGVYDNIGRGYSTTRTADPRLTDAVVQPLVIPHDCEDGFLGAFSRRPHAYLDATVRREMSGFAQLPAGVVEAGLARLAGDLRSGRWHARFAALTTMESADLGYRVVIGRRA